MVTVLISAILSTAAWAEDDVRGAGGHIARAAFTSAISDREPVDNVTQVSAQTKRIFFFTELRGMGGQTVVHRWVHEGTVMAEVPFNVGAPRWRVWSSKNLLPAWMGDWQVFVIDADGNEVGGASFTYGPP